MIAISRGTGIAALVLLVVTGATVAGIVGSNQHHGVTPAAAAGLPSSSSPANTIAPAPSTSSVSTGGVSVAPAPPSGGVVLVVAQPKSQGQPGIVPVPLVPRATAGPIPLLAWEAYHRAAAGSGCKLPWYVLAGIGKIESNHGRYGGAQFDATGTVHPSIFGPPTAYGRAMGPMQFIPPTWASYAADGNNDDITNPQNIFDATKAAAHYLCTAGGPDLSGLAAQRRAVFAYNHLTSYVDDVLAFATAYQHSEPEKVVHLVPIVYAKPAVKVAATTAPKSTTGRTSSAAGTTTSSAPTTSSTTSSTASPSGTTATTTDPTTDPSTTAAPTSPTCATSTSVPSTTASATSAARTSAVRATSAIPAMTSGSTSAVPMRTAAASSTSSASATSPTCPPCPTSTPTSTSTPTTSASPSTTATACPTSPTPTSPTTAARINARRTPKP